MGRRNIASQKEEELRDLDSSSLERRLAILAARWRHNRGNAGERKKIRQQYHDTLKQLYKMGWDSILDWESHLPDEEMPEEYTRRHPRPRNPLTGSLSPKE